MNRSALAGMGMVLCAAMLWGTTGTAQTLAPAGLPAHWVGTLRLLFSALFFAGYVGVTQAAHGVGWSRLPWWRLMLAGASMAAYNLSFFAGVKASSVAVGTAVALGSGPIWAGLLQLAVVRRAPAGAWWLGTLVAVGGGCLMVLGGADGAGAGAAGIVLCLVAGLSYAVYTLLCKHMVAAVPAPVMTLCVFGSAALLALPAAAAASGLPATSPSGWVVVMYLGVVATGVAYLLFTHALARVSVGTAVALCLAEPLTAFVLAIVVVGERPLALAYLGLLLVLLGLAQVVRTELRSATRG